MRQILWDQYETALLIDTCRQVEAGTIARKDAVRELSEKLRARAVNRGQSIDDDYRNEKGISGQLGKIERLVRHVPEAERHNTKLFVEMMEMYRTDREQYESILAEAKGEIVEKTNQEQFMEWLSGRVTPTLLSDYYLAFAYVESFAQRRGILSGSLYDVASVDDIVRIRTALSSPRMQGELGKKEVRRMMEAAQLLQTYVKARKLRKPLSGSAQARALQPAAATAPSEEYVPGKDPVLDFLREKGVEYIDRRYRAGCLWIIGGMEIRETIGTLRKAGVRIAYKAEGGLTTKGRAAWWTKMDTTKVRLEAAAEAETPGEEPARSKPLEPVAEPEQPQDGKADFVAWMTEQGTENGTAVMCRWAVTKVGKYAASDGFLKGSIYDVTDVERLDRIWSHVNQNPEFLEFKKHSVAAFAFMNYRSFRKTATRAAAVAEAEIPANLSAENPAVPRETEPVQAAPMTETERYAAILREHFEDGFRPGHIIDRKRFEQFYEERYGSGPERGMEDVLRVLRKIGTWQDDRIFLRDSADQENLMEEILAKVKSTFEQGATCIYYSELYARYREKLAQQLQIYTVEILAEQVLTASKGVYRGTVQYCCLRLRTPDPDKEVQRLLRHSQVPMNYDAIHQALWYLPLEVIKRSLVLSEDLVNVAQETYFYAENLPMTEEELQDVEELIRGELQQKSYLTDGELRALIQERYPAIAINTEQFTTYGLRDCLKKRLKGRFSFNGPIISAAGQALDTREVFAEFSRSHDHMTLEELSDLAKTVSRGYIYWDSVMKIMTRISAEEFVQRQLIPFDTIATDTVLDELLEGEYMPLKDFKLFLHYPSLPVQWNTFVLESYVFSSSRKFTLLHASFTATECCGAVVRRDSAIKEFPDLVLDVLVHSEGWQTEKEALSLLVDRGYLQKKAFAKIGEIVQKAKLKKKKP